MSSIEISLSRLAKLNPRIILPTEGRVEYLPMDRIHCGIFDHTEAEISSLPSTLTAFQDGDILLAKVTPCFENGNICIASNLKNGIGVGSTELFVLRPNLDLTTPEYLFFLLQEQSFKQEAQAFMRGTGGLKRIPTDWLLQKKFLIPSKQQQHSIVNQLKVSLNKIDRLINKKISIASSLLKYRLSTITSIVTKGLDQNVKMKDSKIPWIGMIPAHWEVRRLGNCFKEVYRKSKTNLPILSISIHHGISDRELTDDDRDRKVWLSEDRSKYQGINKNDLAYNMMRAWQGAFGTSSLEGLVSPAYVVLEPKKDIKSEYFEALLRTENFKNIIYCYSEGIADFRKRLYWQRAKNLYVPVPPYSEQVDIVSSFDLKNSIFNDLISKNQKIIEQLNDYKSYLISSLLLS